MAFTDTWNAAFEALPADNEVLSQGAERIRDHKLAVRERLAVDHSWAGDADDGKHSKVTLPEQGSDPTNIANTGIVYTKDDGSGNTELYYVDEGGNVTQITGASGFVTGSRTLTAGTALGGGGDLSANRTFNLDITEPSEDTAPDLANDLVVTYDDSAASHKKVKLTNISKFSKRYESTQQDLSSAFGSTITLSHGLGVEPEVVTGVLVCLTGELGYSAGDRLNFSLSPSQYAGNANVGVSAQVDSTNIKLHIANATFNVINTSTFQCDRITADNWDLIVRAYA